MPFVTKQLGQLRPANTTATSIYSPGANTNTDIKGIHIANTSGATAAYRLFHDDNGTTYDETTTLAWDVSLAAGETINIDTLISMDDSTGNLAVRTDTANALTFTVYGAERT